MCTITDKITTFNGAIMRSTYNPPMWLTEWFYTNSQTMTSISEDGTQAVLTTKFKVSSTFKKPIWSSWHAYITINNSNVVLVDVMEVLPDVQKPVITNIVQNKGGSLTEWNRINPIRITGTENFCNAVTVKIADEEGNVIYEGGGVVTSNNYSVECIPEVEADINGRKFIATVTDDCGNSTSQEFVISKIDAVEPEPVEKTIAIGGDWAKEKRYTFKATDEGVGAVSVAFNDLGEYKLAGIDESGTFERAYRFIGDVYEPREAVVYTCANNNNR